MQRGPEPARPGERNSIGEQFWWVSWSGRLLESPSVNRTSCLCNFCVFHEGAVASRSCWPDKWGHSRGQGPRMALTMTTSPGIGVGSLSRNLTFSSLTGTSNARLSAEMVSSAGLLRARAVSTAASVCRQGPRARLGASVNRLRRIQHQPARPEQLFSPAPSRSTVVPDTLFLLYAVFPPSTPPLSSCPFPRDSFSTPTLKREKQPIWRGRDKPKRLGSWDTSTCNAAPLVNALTTGSDKKVDRTPSCRANIASCGEGGVGREWCAIANRPASFPTAHPPRGT